VISKNDIKELKALHLKKHRIQNGSFLVEGTKLVEELIQSDYEIDHIYALDCWTNNYYKGELTTVSQKDLGRISSQKNPHDVVALAKMKKEIYPDYKGVTLALDNISDPGNMGTIVRTANWFGIDRIVCSNTTVDCYNSKVLRAGMGAIFNMPIHYLDLEAWLLKNPNKKYGLALSGINIYETDLTEQDVIFVLGNEANGISNVISKTLSETLHITGANKQESLNVAVSSAIVLSEWFKGQ